MIAGPEILVEPLRKFKVNKGENMKVLKIEPKDRLTEYTHIEIQGITIPIENIERVIIIGTSVSIHINLKGVNSRVTIDGTNAKFARSLYMQISEFINQ